MFKFAIFFTLLIVSINAFGYSDCDGYNSLEEEANCTSSGYLIGYGLKYCQRFFTPSYYNRFNAAGKVWVQNTGACLMAATENIVDAQVAANDVNCTAIEIIAFQQHVTCYINNGFCNICGKNLGAILNIFDTQDILYPLSQQQINSVLGQCGLKCFWPF